MSESAVHEAALRLLVAIHDLSGGKLYEPVRITAPEDPTRGAATKAGMDPGSTEDEVALRYLVNQGYVRAAGRSSGSSSGSPGGGQEAPDNAGDEYELTATGLDRARQARGLDDPQPLERGGMSDGTQKMLVTVIGIVGSQVLARPLTRFIGEQVPERRGIGDDVLEAVLKGIARIVALTVASIVVRQLAARRR